MGSWIFVEACELLVAACGIWFPDQGWNAGSLHWKCGILATGKWKSLICVWLLAPGQITGVGSLTLLQGIFPAQGSNPGLPHCGQILYQLSHKGSPRILEWVTYPFSSRSSQPRYQTGVSCIAGRFFTYWAITWEIPREWCYLCSSSAPSFIHFLAFPREDQRRSLKQCNLGFFWMIQDWFLFPLVPQALGPERR